MLFRSKKAMAETERKGARIGVEKVKTKRKTWRWQSRHRRGKRRSPLQKCARSYSKSHAVSGYVASVPCAFPLTYSYCLLLTLRVRPSLQEYHALDPEDVSWMDRELDSDETDAADTLHKRVRIASSTAPKASHRPAQLIPTDADMDVLSLVRPPNIFFRSLSPPF